MSYDMSYGWWGWWWLLPGPLARLNIRGYLTGRMGPYCCTCYNCYGRGSFIDMWVICQLLYTNWWVACFALWTRQISWSTIHTDGVIWRHFLCHVIAKVGLFVCQRYKLLIKKKYRNSLHWTLCLNINWFIQRKPLTMGYKYQFGCIRGEIM